MNNRGQLNNVLGGFITICVFIMVALISAKIAIEFATQAGVLSFFQNAAAQRVLTAMQELPVIFDIGAFVLYAVVIVGSVLVVRRATPDILLNLKYPYPITFI